jgi:hypothetical protein
LELCDTVIHGFGLRMEADYSVAKLHRGIETMLLSALPDMTSLHLESASSSGQSYSPASQPLLWLQAFVLGASGLELPEELDGWLTTAVARHLDPFIDGEAARREGGGEDSGLLTERLVRMLDKDCSVRGVTAPAIRPRDVLVVYLRHAITKMNALYGFQDHIPGLGRAPTSSDEQTTHARRLGVALERALERDFSPDERCVASLPITSDLVAQLSLTHLSGCILYSQSLSNALAAANAEGQEARRRERVRIWGSEAQCSR